jgi:hypothetical protein
VIADAGAELRAQGQQALNVQAAEEKRKLLEAERERKANEEQARRNTAAAAFAQYQVDLNERTADIGNRLTEGKVTREDARKELDEAFGKLKKQHVEGLDTDSQAALKDNLILFDGRARLQFHGDLQKHARQERVDTYQQAREANQRLALTDRDGAIRAMEVLAKTEGAALFGADKAGKDLQAFKEQVVFTDMDRRITASQLSAKGLKTLQAELASDRYADLAPERRGFLEGKIQRTQQHLAHMGEVAERRRMTGLAQQEKRLSWYVENGRDIPPAEFSAFVKASKGTPYEGTADMILAEQKAVSDLIKLSPPEMVAKVKALEQSYGATPSKEQITHLNKVRSFTERSIKQLRESPLDYAVQRDGARIEPLDLAAPASWGQNLQHRTAVLTEQARRTGAPSKGLFPQEVAAFTQMLGAAQPDQKRQMLASLRQGFGDDRVFKATMMQVAADDPVTASAGLAAGRGVESQKDRFLADEMLRGQALLRPNRKEDGKPGGGSLVKMPEDRMLMQTFSTKARDAFADNSEAGDLFFQSARAVYAARTDRAGDMSGVLNGARWEESIEAATGGFTKKNGRWAVMPHGYTEASFRDGLAARVEHIAAHRKLDKEWTPQKLLALPLQNVGDGRYVFRIGDGQLVDENRVPIVIDFTESAPYQPSGEPSADRRPVSRKGRSTPNG